MRLATSHDGVRLPRVERRTAFTTRFFSGVGAAATDERAIGIGYGRPRMMGMSSGRSGNAEATDAVGRAFVFVDATKSPQIARMLAPTSTAATFRTRGLANNASTVSTVMAGQ